MYQVTSMKYSFTGDVISFVVLVTYFQLITCFKNRGVGSDEDHTDSNKELTGRGTSSLSKCSSQSDQNQKRPECIREPTAHVSYLYTNERMNHVIADLFFERTRRRCLVND